MTKNENDQNDQKQTGSKYYKRFKNSLFFKNILKNSISDHFDPILTWPTL